MSEQGRITTHFNLPAVRFELQKHLGLQEPPSWAEIARDTQLGYNTVIRIATNTATRVELDTMARFAEYFNRRGLKVGIQDLIVMEIA